MATSLSVARPGDCAASSSNSRSIRRLHFPCWFFKASSTALSSPISLSVNDQLPPLQTVWLFFILVSGSRCRSRILLSIVGYLILRQTSRAFEYFVRA
ncbi:hypothetical protein ABKN59_009058 [Abortiporus biennis]